MMIGASTYVESSSGYDYSFIGNKIDVKIKEYENKFVVELLVKQLYPIEKRFTRSRGKKWYWCIIPIIHKPMEVVEVLDMDNY